MNKKTVTLTVGIVAFALLLAGALVAYNLLSKGLEPQQDVSVSASKTSKKAAADFTVEDANGKTVSLSDFKGKPVVVNFWASWCYWCKKEMPDYNDLYNQYSGKVVFLMVDLVDGSQETKQDGLSYIKSAKYAFSPYFDTAGEAANAYNISGIPESVYIYPDGTVYKTYSGAIDAATMQKSLAAIMK